MCVNPEPASRQRMLASRLPVSKGNTAVGRRMVTALTGAFLLGLLPLWLFALRALGVPSSVALVLAAPPEPVPAPRCSALAARDRPCQACNASQLPVICLCCRAYPVGSSIADQVHCGPAWRRSALEVQYLVHLRHQRVAVARLLTDLQVLCPPLLKRTPCCVRPKMSPRRHQVQVPDEGRRLQCRSMLLGIRLELQMQDRLPVQLMVHRFQRQPLQLRQLQALAFPLLRRYRLSVLMWGQPWKWDRPYRPLLLQLHFPSRSPQAKARKVPWWSRSLTTWPFRWRSRFGRILERDADREYRCAYKTSDENSSCTSIMCSVPSCPLQAVHFRPLITPVLGPMSAMPNDSDYESLCVPASLTLVISRNSPWFPPNLLWSGGGPARGRLSCSARCSSWLFAACDVPGDLHPLSVLPCCGRCAAPLPHGSSASNAVFLPGMAALALCNPWSAPWDFRGTAVFRCRICIFSCDVISSTVMLGRRAHSLMPHEGFWSHLSPSPLFPPRKGWPLAMLPWCTLSDFDRCYAMAPKPKRGDISQGNANGVNADLSVRWLKLGSLGTDLAHH